MASPARLQATLDAPAAGVSTAARALLQMGAVVLCALPFAAAAYLSYQAGYRSSADEQLLLAAQQLRLTGAPPYFAGSVIGVLLAYVLGSSLKLMLFSALLAGFGIVFATHRMLEVGRGWGFAIFMVLALALLPSFWTSVIISLPRALVLLSVGLFLNGYRDFTLREGTYGGFSAGLWLGLGALASPLMPVFGLLAVVAAPWAMQVRDQRPPRSIQVLDTLLVLLFPLVMVVVLVELSAWLTTGVLITFREVVHHLQALHPNGPAPLLHSGLGVAVTALVAAPVWIGSVVIWALRRSVFALALLWIPGALTALLLIGLPVDTDLAISLLAIAGLVSTPLVLSRRTIRIYQILCVVQIVVGILVWAVTNSWSTPWLEAHGVPLPFGS